MSRTRGASSRDPQAWVRATSAARGTREGAAREVAGQIAEQVAALIVEGDIMGGRALLSTRVQQLVAAERRGDPVVVRAAVIEVAVAAGAWVAALDFEPPRELSANGTAD